METKPVRVAVLCSGSASSFRYLCENDPNFGKSYEVVGVFSDEPRATGVAYAESHGIAMYVLDFKSWRKEYGTRHSDLQGRQDYFARVCSLIAPWRPDLIMLSGFMLIVTDPLLSEFEGRILNVHPALLSLEDEKGKRKYTGLNVVARAMQAGDPTGSTVHIVTGEPDMGPIVAESLPLPYQSTDSPHDHQELMKTACDGPVFRIALEKVVNRK